LRRFSLELTGGTRCKQDQDDAFFRQVIPEQSDPAVFLRNVMETVIVGNVTNCRAAICRINN
jgi:hypothetical protein